MYFFIWCKLCNKAIMQLIKLNVTKNLQDLLISSSTKPSNTMYLFSFRETFQVTWSTFSWHWLDRFNDLIEDSRATKFTKFTFSYFHVHFIKCQNFKLIKYNRSLFNRFLLFLFLSDIIFGQNLLKSLLMVSKKHHNKIFKTVYCVYCCESYEFE